MLNYLTIKMKFSGRVNFFGWAMADQAIVSGVNFLTAILFARYLGVEEFGRFTLLWLIVLFANSIQLAMVSSPMLSIAPKLEKDKSSEYYGSIVVIQLLFSLLSAGIVWLGMVVSSMIYPQWNIGKLAMNLALVVFFVQNQDFVRRVFFSKGQHLYAFLNDAISYLGQLVILVFLFNQMKVELSEVLAVIAITSAIAFLLGIYQNGRISIKKRSLRATVSRNWSFSKWMTASTILQWLSGNVFYAVAGAMLGPATVGAIKASQNIMAVCHVFFLGLENIVPTQASRILKDYGFDRMRRYLFGVVKLGGAVTFIVGLLASLMPELWLKLFYGSQYAGNGFILRWFAIIYLIMSIPFPLRAGLRSLENTKHIFFSYALAALFSVIFSLSLIEYFKISGFLIGMFLSYAMTAIYLFVSFGKVGKYNGVGA